MFVPGLLSFHEIIFLEELFYGLVICEEAYSECGHRPPEWWLMQN